MSVQLKPETTRVEALKHLGEVFREAGIETAQRDARLLLLDAAGIKHADLLSGARVPLGDAATKLAANAGRRITREPVARILGEWEFWSMPFTLTPDTLVPRPDSETVVAAALIGLKDRRHKADGVRILDLGTGSGCLLIALLKELPGATGLGTDISQGALETARFNATRNGVGDRADFIQSDWEKALEGRFDVIVSNPPYIADTVIEGLEAEVRVHDPVLALSGGKDGLDAYRAIAAALPSLLSEGGFATLEIGSDQAETVPAIFLKAGFDIEGPFADFGARPRAITVRPKAA
jgi:release factor glutamine methyltransferase